MTPTANYRNPARAGTLDLAIWDAWTPTGGPAVDIAALIQEELTGYTATREECHAATCERAAQGCEVSALYLLDMEPPRAPATIADLSDDEIALAVDGWDLDREIAGLLNA